MLGNPPNIGGIETPLTQRMDCCVGQLPIGNSIRDAVLRDAKLLGES
jgi:hypothetical protein